VRRHVCRLNVTQQLPHVCDVPVCGCSTQEAEERKHQLTTAWTAVARCTSQSLRFASSASVGCCKIHDLMPNK
jgi:hypothetical protein